MSEEFRQQCEREFYDTAARLHSQGYGVIEILAIMYSAVEAVRLEDLKRIRERRASLQPDAWRIETRRLSGED